MKKILLSGIVSGLLISEACAQNLNLDTGWQLKGTESGLSINDFNKSCINTVWKYNGDWEAYSPNNLTKQLIIDNGISELSDLNINDGFWVNTSDNCIITSSVKSEVINETNKTSSESCNIIEDYFNTGQTINTSNMIKENRWYRNSLVNNNTYFYMINIESDGEYIFSTSSDIDTYGILYDESKKKIAWDDESGDNSNFRITKSLTAGTYYLQVKGFNETKDFKVQYLENAKYFTGKVVDSNNNLLSNATITLTLPEKEITSITDDKGNYSFKTKENIPSTIALTASLNGYGDEAINIYINSQNEFNNDFILTQGLSEVVNIDNTLHHLGDDNYGGTVNSQFQSNTDGIEYTNNFELNNKFLQYDQATLEVFIKGSQDSLNKGLPNYIYMNNIIVGSMGNSPEDGSFEKIFINFPISYLDEGNNIVKIISSEGNTYDDFEFTNLKITASKMDLNDSLLAYFPLKTDIKDASDNNISITDNSSETIENNSSYTFNTNSELIIENQINFKNQLSVIANVKQNSNNGGYLFSKNTDDDSIRYAGLYLGDKSDNYIKFFYTNENGNREALEWDTSIADNIKRTIALTIKYPYATLYINGVSKGTIKMSSKMIAGESDIVIGKRFPNNYYLDGSISELRFYDRAITQSEVLKLNK